MNSLSPTHASHVAWLEQSFDLIVNDCRTFKKAVSKARDELIRSSKVQLLGADRPPAVRRCYKAGAKTELPSEPQLIVRSILSPHKNALPRGCLSFEHLSNPLTAELLQLNKRAFGCRFRSSLKVKQRPLRNKRQAEIPTVSARSTCALLTKLNAPVHRSASWVRPGSKLGGGKGLQKLYTHYV